MKKNMDEASRWFKYVISDAPLNDNIVLKFCYKWTVLILVSFSFIVTSAILFGDSFACFTTFNKMPSDYLNMKCYYKSTYFLPNQVIEDSRLSPITYGQNYRKYQPYYSSVNWYFLVNAFSFYFLYFIWKWYERKHLNKLSDGLQMYANGKRESHDLDLGYIAKHVFIFKGKHKLYAALYIHFELFTHVMCFASTLLLVIFFDVTGVSDFIQVHMETWSDFRVMYFPNNATCEFTLFNGDLVKSMCEMPLNRLFMFMFLFLFGWFILMTTISGVVLIYRIALIRPSIRAYVSKLFTSTGKQPIMNYFDQSDWSYCDWIFMTRFDKAMTDIEFDQMLENISTVLPENDEKKIPI